MEPEDKGVEVKGFRERIKNAEMQSIAFSLLTMAEAFYSKGRLSNRAMRRCRKAYEEKWGNK